MLIYLICAGLVLGAPLTGAWPPLTQCRAFNGFGQIAMPGREIYGPRHDAVLAQEIAEWWTAWAGAFLIGSGPAWLLSTFTPFALAAPVCAMIAWSWRTTDFGRAQIELVGWAAEWLHGRRTAPEAYLDFLAHARRMAGGYLVFKGRDPVALARALRRRLPIARAVLAITGRWLRAKQGT